MPKKNSVEQRIIDALVSAVERGGLLPWQKPWITANPINLTTFRAHEKEGTPEEVCKKYGYRGINPMLLSLSEFASPFWFTYKQAQELGWQIRGGEKSSLIVFWNIIEKTDIDDDGNLRDVKIPLLRYFSVFNVEQADPTDKAVPVPEIAGVNKEDHERTDVQEILSASWLAKTSFTANQAAYIPSQDRIIMPPVDAFKSYAHFYSTWAHESVHATGHQDRLSREGVTNPALFGSERYGFEELIAAIGQAMFCSRTGIQNETMTLEDASYIKGWLKVLRDDPRMIVRAGSAAQKAIDYIFSGPIGENDDSDS